MRRNNRWIVGAGLTLGAVLLLLFWPCWRALRISDGASGRLLWCRRVQVGETFVLSYIHSVNRRPVYDTLRVADDRLVIVGSRFDALGAGMPDGSSGEGELSTAPDGWLVYRLERPIADFVLRVGRVAEHTLLFAKTELPLARLARPGTAVRFCVGRCALIDFIKGRYTRGIRTAEEE